MLSFRAKETLSKPQGQPVVGFLSERCLPFIADPEHLPSVAPLQEEDHRRGFAKTDHVTVSFPLEVTSGSCVIGDDIRPSEGCIEIELTPRSYVFTVSLEVLSEDIGDVGNTAAIRFTAFIEVMEEDN